MFRTTCSLFILLISASLLISSCGGSGGSNASFDLTTLKSTDTGVIYTTTLEGSDSDNVKYTGSLIIENKAPVMIDGVFATPRNLDITLVAEGITVSLAGTSNVDANGNLLSVIVRSTGTACTSGSPDRMPDIVETGDSGVRSQLTCSDSTTNETSWNIVENGNGEARVTSTAIIKDEFGTSVSVTDISFTINSNGNIVSFESVSTHSASNYSLSYQST